MSWNRLVACMEIYSFIYKNTSLKIMENYEQIKNKLRLDHYRKMI